MLDWLIVGGGIHGTHLSLMLTERGGVPRDRLRVLDPYAAPLARWDECSANTGMTFLRSPFVHHLGVEPFGLRAFARSSAGRKQGGFAFPYNRPALSLFRAHTRGVIERHRLAELRVLGKASGLDVCAGGIRVETTDGVLEARRVLLAMGASEQPAWPTWARSLREGGARVDHIFDPGFDRAAMAPWSRVVVLGGGITAAQTALSLAERAPGTVTLLARHRPRVHQFDSDPEWMGPLRLDGYAAVADLGVRRRLIAGARHRGSIPVDVMSALRRAVHQGAVIAPTASVLEARVTAHGFQLDLDGGQGPIDADHLVLATGFERARPGGPWLDRAIEKLGLSCAACGYPIVDRALRWHPGIHVTGPLAELELGPPARNILGARFTAERLLAAA